MKVENQTENKIVLVERQTRLDELVARYNTLDQARFYVEHLGSDFSDYLREHDQYKQSSAMARMTLRSLGRVQVLKREFLPNFIFGANDTVVVLGQDGLVANTIKYLDRQLVVGVNPDPGRWDGVLLPFTVEDLDRIIPEVFRGERKDVSVTMAQATLDDGQSLYAVNDFFIGARSHVSARYALWVEGEVESQSSSGIIVSTGLGSTGWLKSVLAGATGIASAICDTRLKVKEQGRAPWDADFLYYTVREPFPSNTTGVSMVYGKITRGQTMVVESHMANIGVIFSDGIEKDFLEFNSGMRASVKVADKSGRLVV
ncbi:MAG: sugar kinase [Nitrospinota bacterium]|nr:sugar kinase [Nitrospinota bacterium]